MGGGQSLTIGLTHLEQFAWVGGMSASVAKREFVLGGVINGPKVANRQLKLLWFACGKSDGLMRPKTCPRNGREFQVDATTRICQRWFMLGENENQFSLTRAALSIGGRAKSKLL